MKGLIGLALLIACVFYFVLGKDGHGTISPLGFFVATGAFLVGIGWILFDNIPNRPPRSAAERK
ncbi:MAG TPA: hypothetical protein VMT99_00855 [Candidatus Paceibacterota bacterium]|nr:hypothetical protein [Candidatus Paceibacterota bacterium]